MTRTQVSERLVSCLNDREGEAALGTFLTHPRFTPLNDSAHAAPLRLGKRAWRGSNAPKSAPKVTRVKIGLSSERELDVEEGHVSSGPV